MTSPNAALPRASGRMGAIFRNAGILLGGRTASALLGLAYIAIGARVLGAETFGLLVLITAFGAAVGDFLRFQSWQAVIHYGSAPLADGHVPALQAVIRFAVALDLASGVLGAALGATGALVLAERLGWPPGVAPVAAAYATVCLFAITSAAGGILRVYDRFDLLAGESAFRGAVRLTGAIAAWALDGGLSGFLIAAYLSEAAAFVYLYGASWREMRRRGHADGLFTRTAGPALRFPGLWRFVWITNLNSSLSALVGHVGLLAVGAVLGPAAAGLYRVARQVADAAAKPAKLLTPAVHPEFARLWAAGDRVGLHRLAGRLALTAAGAAALLLGIAAIAGESLLALIAGEAFRSAAPVMLWLLAGAAVALSALPLEPVLMSTRRAGSALAVRIAASGAYLAGLWPLLDRFGLQGAGMASAGAAVLLASGQLWAVLRNRRTPLEP